MSDNEIPEVLPIVRPQITASEQTVVSQAVVTATPESITPADPALINPRPGVMPTAVPVVERSNSPETDWIYIHSAPAEFGEGGVRCNQRLLIIEGLGDNASCRLQINTVNEDGTINQLKSREWRFNKAVLHRDTPDATAKWTDVRGRDKTSPQTLNLSGFHTVEVFNGDATHAPTLTFVSPSGVRKAYILTAVIFGGTILS